MNAKKLELELEKESDFKEIEIKQEVEFARPKLSDEDRTNPNIQIPIDSLRSDIIEIDFAAKNNDDDQIMRTPEKRVGQSTPNPVNKLELVKLQERTELLIHVVSESKLLDYKITELLKRIQKKDSGLNAEIMAIKKLLVDFLQNKLPKK